MKSAMKPILLAAVLTGLMLPMFAVAQSNGERFSITQYRHSAFVHWQSFANQAWYNYTVSGIDINAIDVFYTIELSPVVNRFNGSNLYIEAQFNDQSRCLLYAQYTAQHRASWGSIMETSQAQSYMPCIVSRNQLGGPIKLVGSGYDSNGTTPANWFATEARITAYYF